MVILLLAGAAIWLLRGPVYRSWVGYVVGGERASVHGVFDEEAVADSLYVEHGEDVDAYIHHCLKYTAMHLRFAPKNELSAGRANCVGYASVLRRLLSRNIHHYGDYGVLQSVAKLRVMGYDVHKMTDDPFFADHDVVTIIQEGVIVRVVDPSLYDVTGIEAVRYER